MTLLKKISIRDKNKSFKYPIFIGTNFIELLKNNFFKSLKEKKIYVIYDEFFNRYELNKNLIKDFKKLSILLNSQVFFFQN